MSITIDNDEHAQPLRTTDGPATVNECEWASAFNLLWHTLGDPPNAEQMVWRMGLLLGSAKPGWRAEYAPRPSEKADVT